MKVTVHHLRRAAVTIGIVLLWAGLLQRVDSLIVLGVAVLGFVVVDYKIWESTLAAQITQDEPR